MWVGPARVRVRRPAQAPRVSRRFGAHGSRDEECLYEGGGEAWDRPVSAAHGHRNSHHDDDARRHLVRPECVRAVERRERECPRRTGRPGRFARGPVPCGPARGHARFRPSIPGRRPVGVLPPGRPRPFHAGGRLRTTRGSGDGGQFRVFERLTGVVYRRFVIHRAESETRRDADRRDEGAKRVAVPKCAPRFRVGA